MERTKKPLTRTKAGDKIQLEPNFYLLLKDPDETKVLFWVLGKKENRILRKVLSEWEGKHYLIETMMSQLRDRNEFTIKLVMKLKNLTFVLQGYQGEFRMYAGADSAEDDKIISPRYKFVGEHWMNGFIKYLENLLQSM